MLGYFDKFRTILEYKCAQRGCEIIVGDKWYASSKLCNCCGYKNDDLKISDRTFVCHKCGTKLDRDYNAALNLLDLIK